MIIFYLFSPLKVKVSYLPIYLHVCLIWSFLPISSYLHLQLYLSIYLISCAEFSLPPKLQAPPLPTIWSRILSLWAFHFLFVHLSPRLPLSIPFTLPSCTTTTATTSLDVAAQHKRLHEISRTTIFLKNFLKRFQLIRRRRRTDSETKVFSPLFLF